MAYCLPMAPLVRPNWRTILEHPHLQRLTSDDESRREDSDDGLSPAELVEATVDHPDTPDDEFVLWCDEGFARSKHREEGCGG
mmetsp:Transcript_4239/g.9603  ORF Transcript_4239/g.9603 Transcript_4239/m.9603 type:complete len:83 (+) Transcript_4239:320-568(+)